MRLQSSSPGGVSSSVSIVATERSQEPRDANEEKGVTTLETFEDQQDRILLHKKLMIVFPCIAMAEMIAYLDQTIMSTALPAIGSSLNLGPSISWAAACFLVASTSIQLINGRLSDIIGRKPLLIACMGILAISDLCAGFSQNSIMLFAFRSLAGLGGGAITALIMIIASDITTLEQRGRYNGFIGAMNALGNGLGPLLGGALTERASWRWCFWFIVPVIVTVMIIISLVIPPSEVKGNPWSKIRMIDWLGLSVNIAVVLLILIPLSEGGSLYAWKSPLVISMLTLGSILIFVFVLVEWKVARLPIMPIRLFQSDYSANLVLIMATMQGVVYWANLFYIPLYLQTVRGYSPIMSGVIILPMVASHGIGSLVSGQIISRTGHYGPIIIVANFVWLLGISLQTLYTRTTPVWMICVVGFLEGIGIGCTFQPSLIALLAHSRKADRAVTNSLRNFLRIMGGSIGLTGKFSLDPDLSFDQKSKEILIAQVSGTILNNILNSRLKGDIPPEIIRQLSSAAYSLASYDLTPDQIDSIIHAYMEGLHLVFIIYPPILAVGCISALLIRDKGVAEKDATLPVPPPVLQDQQGMQETWQQQSNFKPLSEDEKIATG